MRLSRNGLAHRVSARRRAPKMSRVVFLPHSAFLRPDVAWPSGCRVVPDTASSRNTRSCLLELQRRNGEPAPRRRHRMWGSVTSVLTCPLFSPLVLTLPHHTHKHTTHKHKEKVSGAPPSTIQAFGRTEHTGKSDGSTATRLFSTVNVGTKLGGSQGQAQKAATRVFRGGEMFENSDPSDHPCHLCWNGRRWLPS